MSEHFIPRVTFGDAADAKAVFDMLNHMYATAEYLLFGVTTDSMTSLVVTVHAEYKRLQSATVVPTNERCSFCNALIGVESHAGGCSS